LKYLKLPVAMLVTLFYALVLVVDRSAGVIYSLLLLLALAGIIGRARPEGKTFFLLAKEYWPLLAAMSAPLVAVLANQLATGHFAGRSYDSQSRLALFGLVFWVMLLVPLNYLKQVQWGLIVGACLAIVKIYTLTAGGETRYGTDFIPIIIFAELVLLLGVFSLFSIAWDKRHSWLLMGLKIVAAGAGVYAAYLSQSRGTWVTIFVFAILGSMVVRHIPRVYKIGAAIVFAVVVAGVFQHSSILKERLAVAEKDIQLYTTGTDRDTSLGIRFQLWHGSWILFKEHPLFGVGVEQYQGALQELAERKIISPFSASLPHSHNEILFMMARLGVLGLLAILAVYFVPLYYFIRDVRHADMEVRCVAGMGMALSLGFFTLGLVDVVFLWWECYPFYAISTAFCMTYVIKRKSFLAQQVLRTEPAAMA